VEGGTPSPYSIPTGEGTPQRP